MTIKKIVSAALLLLSAAASAQDYVEVPNVNGIQTPAWEDAITKAKNIVSTLTLEEKVGLATGVGWEKGRCVGNIAGISRINFPGLCLEDSPTGVRFTQNASAFPAGVNVAATWDRKLMYARGVAMGEEYRGKGVNVALGPMMNIARVAAGGRNWEGAGGDPYLAAEVAIQNIAGVQSTGVMACAKHYLGNEQEHYRTLESSNIDDRTVHEVYAWPFMRSVQAGVASLMCSYNQVNNTYACQNERSLTQVLKNENHFQGFVMSDWWATMSGVPSANAGLDMTMPGDIAQNNPGDSYWGQHLIDAVNNGQVAQQRVDDMAIRILTPWYLLNQDKDFPATNFDAFNPGNSQEVNVQGEHYKNIRDVGAASTILLKNADVQRNFTAKALPITSESKLTIALIGSDAGPSSGGPNGCADHGCNDGTLAQGWGSGTTNFPYLVTPFDGLSEVAKKFSQKIVTSFSDSDLNAAKNTAQQADIAIVFVNSDSGEDYITVEGNEGDRSNLNVWHNGDDLINAVASVHEYTIVVIHTVGPVLMPWSDHPNVTAIVLAGLPGQESGNALADVLYGSVNPSAKLVYTVAHKEEDYPAQVVYSSTEQVPQIDYKEGLFVDYRWFDKQSIAPLYEFGYGLSYTSFKYAGLNIDINKNNKTNPYYATITAQIFNTGDRAGAEVAQLYIGIPEAGEPAKILRGFDKIYLNKGEDGTVTFKLTLTDISIWNVVSQSWEVPSGTYNVYVGASSRDIKLTSSFSI